jgi:uncharacterized protein YndB with AHSA1/START domain
MAKIDKSIEVNASGTDVFDVLTDLDRLPAWSTITVETHGTPRQPIEQGDTFEQTLRILGRTIQAQWRVVELDRPRRVAYETEAPGGGKCTARTAPAVLRWNSTTSYQAVSSANGSMRRSRNARNERELEHSLHNLKELLESRPTR